MKKLLLIIAGFVLTLGVANNVFAASSMLDYTYIDCHAGNDTKAEPFNSAKPYNTLAIGVQASIGYINTNWNIPSQAQNVLGKRFVIKAKAGCVFDGLTQSSVVTVLFNGNVYKNDLLITSSDDTKTFGVQSMYFYDGGQATSGLVLKNVDFMNSSNGTSYFQFMYSQGNTIQNSIIRCKTWSCINNTSYYASNIIIDNSIIKINSTIISGDTNFYIPGIVRNSKIEYTTPNGSTSRLVFNSMYSVVNLMLGNIIDAGNQEVTIGGVDTITNKFTNIKKIIPGSIFANNTVQNTQPITVGVGQYTVNNVFTGGYTDNNDPSNLRRNFSSAQTTGGIGWLYQKALGTMLESNFTDRSLYQQYTGNTMGDTNSPIYLMFR